MSDTQLIWLSWPLDEDTPAYGNGERFSRRILRSLERGDTSNNAAWSFPNHLGSHLDAPLHFDQQGKSVDMFSADDLYFQAPAHVSILAAEGELISPEQVPPIRSDADILLIQTGFSVHRQSDRYWQDGPGIAPEMAGWLRKQYPDVRAIGFDFISLTAWHDRVTGREAHREFLATDPPLLILEDLNLTALNPDVELLSMQLAPLRVSGSDGAPVTVIAQVRRPQEP